MRSLLVFRIRNTLHDNINIAGDKHVLTSQLEQRIEELEENIREADMSQRKLKSSTERLQREAEHWKSLANSHSKQVEGLTYK